MSNTNLSNVQQAAVEYPPEHRLKIVAGAGSGKTEILTRRIVSLHKQGVAAKDLVAVTYTRKAAAEMKQRLVNKLGLPPRIFQEMHVNTFHAFLGKILRSDPFNVGLDGEEKILSEAHRDLLLEEVYENFLALFANELSNPQKDGFDLSYVHDLVQEFPNVLKKIRRFMIGSANELLAFVECAVQKRGYKIKELEKKVRDWLYRFYILYQTALKDKNFLDYDEILIRGAQLVKKWHEAGYTAGPKVFLIDEFQDNNTEQLAIVESFLEGRNDGHITVVGDFRQSIYRFQGADVSTFVNFKATKEIVLQENYRSCQEIVDLANTIIRAQVEENFDREDDYDKNTLDQIASRGFSKRKKPIACLISSSDDASVHANAIADLIQTLVNRGLKLEKTNRPLTYSNVAIIVPSVKRLPAVFEDAFIDRGIPYQMSGGMGFYDRSEIAEIIAFLRLLVNPHDDYSLVKIFTGLLFTLTDSELTSIAFDDSSQSASLWERFELRYSKAPQELPDAALRFRRFFADLHARSLSSTGVLDLVYYLIEEAGFKEYAASLNNKLRRRRLENNLNKFIAIVREFEQSGVFTTLRDFLKWYERVENSDVSEDEISVGIDDLDAVKIMTIHKAKGLQFPLVIMPNLKKHKSYFRSNIAFTREHGLLVKKAYENVDNNRERYNRETANPWRTFVQSERLADEAEELRKLYVAITRAEELLVITGDQKHLKTENEPLKVIKDWIETNSDRNVGIIADIKEVSNVAEAWLADGTSPKPAISAVLPEIKSDLQSLMNDIAAVRNFLESNDRIIDTFDSSLSQPDIKRTDELHQKHDEIFSLRELEQYELCPRRYFFDRKHLSPFGYHESDFHINLSNEYCNEDIHVVGDIDSRDNRPYARDAAICAGKLVHHVLRLFHESRARMSNIGKTNDKYKNGANRETINKITSLKWQDVHAELLDWLERLIPLYGELGRLVRNKVVSLLEAYACSPLAFQNAWLLEAEVNLRLIAPSGPFIVRGFVDRVDLDGHDIKIIDYKTHPFQPRAHNAYTRQMALYLAAIRHGILGNRGNLTFAEALIAYITPMGVEVYPVEPDTVSFENWAISMVEAIRREKSWLSASNEASCVDCGFLLLCDRKMTAKPN